MNRKNEFLEKLASLVDEYDVEISYTTDDDGLHVFMDGNNFVDDELFTGCINGKDCSKNIRAAKDT